MLGGHWLKKNIFFIIFLQDQDTDSNNLLPQHARYWRPALILYKFRPPRNHKENEGSKKETKQSPHGLWIFLNLPCSRAALVCYLGAEPNQQLDQRILPPEKRCCEYMMPDSKTCNCLNT